MVFAQQLQSTLGPEKKVVGEDERAMDIRREVKLSFVVGTSGK